MSDWLLQMFDPGGFSLHGDDTPCLGCSRKLFRIAVEASPNAILIVDQQSDVVLANSQAESVFGYAADELVGKSLDVLIPLHLEPLPAGSDAGLLDLPGNRVSGACRELAGVRKDGSGVPLEMRLAPVHLAEGDGVLALLVDITERKQLHTQLHRAQRLAAVGELAAGVAHEINNPINTMINCAQLILDGEPAGEQCRNIIEEGARISTIVKDLLGFACEDRAQPQPTSLGEVVGRTLRLVGENLKRHGIGLEVDVPADLPAVHAQPQQLQQVLLNLVVNARDALQHGSRPVRRIELRAGTGDRGTVWCSVRDSGPGIAADLLARVFDPFFTTKRAQGGCGLGLSISTKIIESFGGTLAGRSVAGEFAEFRFVLPQAETNGWAAGARRLH